MHKVTVEIGGRTLEIEIKKPSVRVDSFLEKFLSIYPETAVVLKNGELLCDDDRIESGDKIKVVVATSKG